MVTAAPIKKGYKQTEVGLIPSDWGVERLDKVFSITAGRDLIKDSFSLTADEDHTVPIYSNSLQNRGLYGYTKIARHKKNSVTVTARGMVGGANSRDHAFDAIGRLLILEPIERSNCFYLSEYLNNRVTFSIESTGVPQLTAPQASKYLVALPDPKEQDAIATVLSDTDALIAKLEKLIAKKRDIKTATMQQLLTGKKRLAGFSGEWKPIDMSKHARLKARIGWQALTTAEYRRVGTHFLVTGTDFVNGRVDWSTCHFVDKWRYDQDSNIQLRNDDVLLTKDGTIGKVGFVENIRGPATLNSGVFVIRPLERSFVPLFLFYVLASRIFDEFLSKITAGSTINHLYQKDFVTFGFLAPDVIEQTAISDILSDMDVEITTLETRLSKTKDLKRGMMQQLLTGNIRLV